MRTILSCVLVLGLFHCLGKDVVAAAPSIEQVKRELKGKSMGEVRDTLGRANRVTIEGGKRQATFWQYKYEVSDPDSGLTFPFISIYFENQRVVRVTPEKQ